jgi:hypothetical protein
MCPNASEATKMKSNKQICSPFAKEATNRKASKKSQQKRWLNFCTECVIPRARASFLQHTLPRPRTAHTSGRPKSLALAGLPPHFPNFASCSCLGMISEKRCSRPLQEAKKTWPAARRSKLCFPQQPGAHFLRNHTQATAGSEILKIQQQAS